MKPDHNIDIRIRPFISNDIFKCNYSVSSKDNQENFSTYSDCHQLSAHTYNEFSYALKKIVSTDKIDEKNITVTVEQENDLKNNCRDLSLIEKNFLTGAIMESINPFLLTQCIQKKC